MEDSGKSVDIVVASTGSSKLDCEASCIMARQRKVKQGLQSLGRNVTENSDAPVIAVMASGGGMRAMIACLGTLSKLAEFKLLDVATYLSGTSGSTWCLSLLCQDKNWSDHAYLEQMENYLSSHIESSWDWKKGWRKVEETYLEDIYSLTNIWAHFVVNPMTKNINEATLSSHKDGCESGENPYPIYSAVQKEYLGTYDPGAWFEFTPHLSGFPAYGCFVKTELLGSKFEAGKLLTKTPEHELSYLDGLWGSAFASDMVIRDNLKNIFEHVISRAEEVSKKSLLELSEEEEAEQDAVCNCKGCTKIRELMSQDFENIAGKKETVGSDFAEILEGAIKKLQEEGEAIGPTDICQSFKILKHTLTCLTQWKWGTINNFLYNWKSGIPSSLYSKEHIFLIDAGLEINTAFPLLLPPYRKVDLFLSFDYSQGDPFGTLKQTAEYCEKNGVPFPKINIDDIDKDIPTKCCYVFEGDGSGAPDVMHFPLFNAQTCAGKVEEMRQKYSTDQSSYNESLFKELIQEAKNNVSTSIDEIQNKISECVNKCTQRSAV